MITQQQYESVVERSAQMLKQAGIVITPEERARLRWRILGWENSKRLALRSSPM